MSTRVKHIKKSMEEYTCSRCGDTIPKGSAYQYFKPGFRGRTKVRRCMKPECAPRRSELTDNKLSAVYAAQEDAETNLGALKWSDEGSWEEQVEDIENALGEAAEAAEEVAQEYEEAIDAAPMLEDRVGELRDAQNDWVGELQSWQPPDEPVDEEDNASEKFDQAVQDAIEVLGNLGV